MKGKERRWRKKTKRLVRIGGEHQKEGGGRIGRYCIRMKDKEMLLLEQEFF
jgi:hypothetical protein